MPIARELHDVVAHHMSVVAIQAEAAPYRVPAPSPEVKRSLALIRTHAVEALTELQRVLGVLRDGGTPDGTAPPPGIDRLGELVSTAGQVGLDVRHTVHGLGGPLPAGVDLSACRIVQEALSNVMRARTRRGGRCHRRCPPRPARAPDRERPGAASAHNPPGGRTRTARHARAREHARWHPHRRPDPGGGFTVRVDLPLGPAAVDGQQAR